MALFGKKKRATGQAMDLRPNGNLQQPLPQQAQQPKKRSVLPYVLAAAEDTLSRQMGYQPQGVARLNEMNAQRQQEAAALAAEQRKRSMAREDKQWEWQNKPQDPYRWRNNNGDLMEQGPDGRPRMVYDDPTDKTQWIQVKDPLTGEIRIIPQGPGAPNAAPPPDVLPPDFDFGETSGSNAAPTFR